MEHATTVAAWWSDGSGLVLRPAPPLATLGGPRCFPRYACGCQVGAKVGAALFLRQNPVTKGQMPAERNASEYQQRFQNEASAERYARRFERGSRRRTDRRERRALQRLLAGLPEVRTVLDVPTGAGRLLPTLAAGGRRVLGIDAARQILAHAVVRPESVLGLCQADAMALPLADDAVDAIVCNRLLHHLPAAAERARVLSELRRVSRYYVIVSFFDFHRAGGWGFGTLRRWLKRLRGRRPDYAGQPTAAQFAAEVQTCGFAVRAVQPIGPFWVAQRYWLLAKR